jgi:uncharacterized protein YndB with AHSA1/START domain
MASILHRITIDAPTELVQPLLARKEGPADWWTARPVEGDDEVGGRLGFHFSAGDRPAAVMEVAESSPTRVVWDCVEGPDDWVGTRLTFALSPRPDGGTTLLFSHEGWESESEFMAGCTTNWGAYLTSLKSGAEGRGFRPYPAGEISRWG